jgi:hypothetical protein
VSEAYCTVPVNGETTTADLIQEALICFGLENFKCEDYHLNEVLMDRGGTFEQVTFLLPVSTTLRYSHMLADLVIQLIKNFLTDETEMLIFLVYLLIFSIWPFKFHILVAVFAALFNLNASCRMMYIFEMKVLHV